MRASSQISGMDEHTQEEASSEDPKPVNERQEHIERDRQMTDENITYAEITGLS